MPQAKLAIEKPNKEVEKQITKRRDDEHEHQKALFQWAKQVSWKHPELAENSKLFFAVPNGGHRDVKVGRKLKAEGVKAGIWDVFLLVPRGGYHALAIEMKAGKNTLTPEQQLFEAQATDQGFLCLTFWDWQKASEAIINYLEIKWVGPRARP